MEFSLHGKIARLHYYLPVAYHLPQKRHIPQIRWIPLFPKMKVEIQQEYRTSFNKSF